MEASARVNEKEIHEGVIQDSRQSILHYKLVSQKDILTDRNSAVRLRCPQSPAPLHRSACVAALRLNLTEQRKERMNQFNSKELFFLNESFANNATL